MDFGTKLKELRTEKKLTQSQISNLLGTSKSNISKYEANTIEPNFDTLIKIHQLFGVSMDYLFGFDENEFKKPETNELNFNEQHILDLYRQDPEGITELLESFSALSRRNKTIILGKCYELEKEDTTVNSDMTDKEKEVRKAT